MSQKLREALARGYCSPENSHKELDATLIEAMVKEIAALSQPAKAVPGWKLVPVEADDAMLDRAVAFALNGTITQGYGCTEWMRDLYRTLLAAAPAPVAAPSEADELLRRVAHIVRDVAFHKQGKGVQGYPLDTELDAIIQRVNEEAG